jgi:hypothetical protein
MSDIKRQPTAESVHHVHLHKCPKCGRSYTCNCAKQPEDAELVCIDCERAGA